MDSAINQTYKDKVKLLDEEKESLSATERLQRFGQNDHKRVFGMNAGRFLEEVGFIVETIDGRDYLDEILPIVGLMDYDKMSVGEEKKLDTDDGCPKLRRG